MPDPTVQESHRVRFDAEALDCPQSGTLCAVERAFVVGFQDALRDKSVAPNITLDGVDSGVVSGWCDGFGVDQ